eukprot:scaffold36964_cov23-Tisochrysis_lutea.AAC.1
MLSTPHSSALQNAEYDGSVPVLRGVCGVVAHILNMLSIAHPCAFAGRRDAEYDDSVLVQCDMCGVTVHTQCYGLGRDCGAAVGGDLWLCDVCTLKDRGLKVRLFAACAPVLRPCALLLQLD